MLRWAQSDPLAIVEGKRDDADHVGCRAAVADKDDDPKLGGIVHDFHSEKPKFLILV